MSLKKPTIVIFDMDGTTVRHLSPFVLTLCEKFDDAAFRVSKFLGWIFHRRGQGPILPAQEYQNRQSGKPRRLLVHRTIHWLRRKPVDQIVEPCPGIYEVLDFLKSHGIPMAMVSNGLGKGYGHDILEQFGLEKYYRATLFREDIPQAKPHPDSILLALREMKIKLTKDDVVWYIGDRHKDITAALAAAKHLPCKIEPLAYGMNAAAAVIEKGLGHSHIIRDYKAMKVALARLFKERPAAAGVISIAHPPQRQPDAVCVDEKILKAAGS